MFFFVNRRARDGALLLLAACATTGTPTVTIYEDANRVVRLQAFSGGYEGKAFSHPVSLTEDDVANVLRGLRVETRAAPLERLVPGRGAAGRRPAFSHTEIEFFSPLLVKGLHRAKPDEAVAFYETAEIDDVYELTTSGAVFVRGDVMHVVLSNDGVRTAIWQDNEHYRPPVRDRPMEPIDPEPGRLVFEPEAFMAPPHRGFVMKLLRGEPWQVGVRFRELR